MNYTVICPCKGCTERKLLCHSTCEGYKAFEEQNKARYDAKLKEIAADDAEFMGMRRRINSKRRKK